MKPIATWALLCAVLPIAHRGAAPRQAWVATWAATPSAADADSTEPLLHLENQTVRERVRVSVGGSQIRLRLSNEFAAAPLPLGAVAVASPDGPAGVHSASLRAVTFGGRSSVTIPPGAALLSDPVDFPVAQDAEISISLYFPKRVTAVTWHWLALRRAVVSGPGDHTHDTTIEGGTESESEIAVTGVFVPAHPSQRLIVAFGGSIEDGFRSTPDSDRTWPSDLIRRLSRAGMGSSVAVVNEGVGGNRLLNDGPLAMMSNNALARFDRDVVSLPGVTHIVLDEGLNDIGFPGAKMGESLVMADAADSISAEDVIDADRQLIARAHLHGIKVIGATMTPISEANGFIPGYYSDAKEATRQAVNRWIRTSGEFDGVIDFDRALRDPDHPDRFLPRFAARDHLHPNDAGYRAMADAIDLSVFR